MATPIPPSLTMLDSRKSMITPTVLLFGTTGSGKSSVINMLPNDPAHPQPPAEAKFDAKGVTSEIQQYHKLVQNKKFIFLDSMGTGEGKTGTVPTNLAIEKLYDYLLGMTTGIHLVMMVMKAGRITAIEESNFLLTQLLFGDEVPIVLALTHLEQEEDKNTWWDSQQDKGRLGFKKSVGLVATVGRRNMFKEVYEESIIDLQRFVFAQANKPADGFKLERKSWFPSFTDKMKTIVQLARPEGNSLHNDLRDLLLTFQISTQEAVRLAVKMRVADRFPVVVLFGRSGVGKSTIVDLLKSSEKDSEEGRHAATGEKTAQVQEFTKIIDAGGQTRVRVIDTPGVGSDGTTPFPHDTINALRSALVLETAGINLVLLVVNNLNQGLTIADANHYHLVRSLFGNKVPICLVSTNPNVGVQDRSNYKEYNFWRTASIPLPPTGRHKTKNIIEPIITEALKHGDRHKILPRPDVLDRLRSIQDLASECVGDDFDRRLHGMLKPKNVSEGPSSVPTTTPAPVVWGLSLDSRTLGLQKAQLPPRQQGVSISSAPDTTGVRPQPVVENTLLESGSTPVRSVGISAASASHLPGSASDDSRPEDRPRGGPMRQIPPSHPAVGHQAIEEGSSFADSYNQTGLPSPPLEPVPLPKKSPKEPSTNAQGQGNRTTALVVTQGSSSAKTTTGVVVNRPIKGASKNVETTHPDQHAPTINNVSPPPRADKPTPIQSRPVSSIASTPSPESGKGRESPSSTVMNTIPTRRDNVAHSPPIAPTPADGASTARSRSPLPPLQPKVSKVETQSSNSPAVQKKTASQQKKGEVHEHLVPTQSDFPVANKPTARPSRVVTNSSPSTIAAPIPTKPPPMRPPRSAPPQTEKITAQAVQRSDSRQSRRSHESQKREPSNDTSSILGRLVASMLKPSQMRAVAPPVMAPSISFPIARNIILFGDVGAGKSSVVNMVDGGLFNREAPVAHGPGADTLKHETYNKYFPSELPGGIPELVQVHDTAGINNKDAGNAQAIESLCELITTLPNVHLLVLVIRGPYVRPTTLNNYRLAKCLVGDEVPIVLIVTGLGYDADPDGWWTRREAAFARDGMHFAGVACITATRGELVDKEAGLYKYDKAYDASIIKVRKLLTAASTRGRVESPVSNSFRPRSLSVDASRVLQTFGVNEEATKRILVSVAGKAD